MGASKPVEPEALLQMIAARFPSYHDVENFAEARAGVLTADVDFWP
jgi:hypothetical protein